MDHNIYFSPTFQVETISTLKMSPEYKLYIGKECDNCSPYFDVCITCITMTGTWTSQVSVCVCCQIGHLWSLILIILISLFSASLSPCPDIFHLVNIKNSVFVIFGY